MSSIHHHKLPTSISSFFFLQLNKYLDFSFSLAKRRRIKSWCFSSFFLQLRLYRFHIPKNERKKSRLFHLFFPWGWKAKCRWILSTFLSSFFLYFFDHHQQHHHQRCMRWAEEKLYIQHDNWQQESGSVCDLRNEEEKRFIWPTLCIYAMRHRDNFFLTSLSQNVTNNYFV